MGASLEGRCPEWPRCTGHAGPTLGQQRIERLAAARRVRIRRLMRCAIMEALRAQGLGLS